jgi:membrane protein required for colicin V production
VNWLDVVLICLLAASVFSGFSKGLVRQVFGLAAAVVGLICGAWFYRMPAESLRPYVGSQAVANLCGFLLIFAGAMFLGWIVSALIGMLVKAVGLSWLNRLGGVAFGVVRGVVIGVAVITAMVAFAPGKDAPNHANDPPQAVIHSRLAPYILDAAHALTLAAPRELRDEFARRYEEIRRVWEEAMKHGLRRLPDSEI